MARGLGAIVLGMLAVVVPSIGMDALFRSLGVLPPWDQPMDELGDNLLALGYRCAAAVLGSSVTARLAPRAPMTHVWIGGGIGCVLSIGGVVAALNSHLCPLWYPVGITLTSLPCAWLGGRLSIPRNQPAPVEANPLIARGPKPVTAERDSVTKIEAILNVRPRSALEADRITPQVPDFPRTEEEFLAKYDSMLDSWARIELEKGIPIFCEACAARTRTLEFNSRAYPSPELMTDSCMWGDETAHAWCLPCKRATRLRFMARYRLTVGDPCPPSVTALWEKTERFFPTWPLFRPERRSKRIKTKVRKLVDNMNDELETEVDSWREDENPSP